MIPVQAALQEVLSRASQLAAEPVRLVEAQNRVLREPARADLDSPPFDASAMDGYALNTEGARPPDGLLPAAFRVIGTSAAGAVFPGAVDARECVRIFTGAPVPTGADCVVKQEDTTRAADEVSLKAIPPRGAHIRRRGENRRGGEIVVAAGSRLGPTELAALASCGVSQPLVTRRPRCVHVVTGDEIVAPAQIPVGAQIRDSNSTLIAALLAGHGAEPVGHVHVRDDLAAAQAALAALPPYDVLLISGGASVGDLDFARPALTALGYTLHFQQVNLRPGKPLVFATRNAQLAFVLPGNPVSHWVTFNLFVAPLLRKLETGLDQPSEPRRGRLAADSPLPAPDARQTIWPARVNVMDGENQLTLLALASSGDSSGLVGANALVPLPAKGLQPSEPVAFINCS